MKTGAFVFLGVLGLIFIRVSENWIFYDPFISYFKTISEANEFPFYDASKLFISIFFRFSLNSIVSLFILFVVFKKWSYIKLAIVIYFFVFIVLSITYFWILKAEFSNGYLIGFYVRRFLIHPMLLLLFFPSFYFLQKRVLA